MDNYKIGTKYLTTGKIKRECTVTDILTTYDNSGAIVKVRYIAVHEFFGQLIADCDVNNLTIARGLITNHLN